MAFILNAVLCTSDKLEEEIREFIYLTVFLSLIKSFFRKKTPKRIGAIQKKNQKLKADAKQMNKFLIVFTVEAKKTDLKAFFFLSSFTERITTIIKASYIYIYTHTLCSFALSCIASSCFSGSFYVKVNVISALAQTLILRLRDSFETTPTPPPQTQIR